MQVVNYLSKHDYLNSIPRTHSKIKYGQEWYLITPELERDEKVEAPRHPHVPLHECTCAQREDKGEYIMTQYHANIIH